MNRLAISFAFAAAALGPTSQSFAQNAAPSPPRVFVNVVNKTFGSNDQKCASCGELFSTTQPDKHNFLTAGGEEFAVRTQKDRGTFLPVSRTNSDPGLSAFLDASGGRKCDGSDCHSAWQLGACHEACSANEEFSIAAIREARSGNLAGIAKVIAASGGVIRLNVERGALQVLGCNNTIAQHIPLSRRLVASLSESIVVGGGQ